MINLNKWENYGDVNPIQHGGVFVQKDILGIKQFYFLSVQPMDEGGFMVIDGYIDLDEEWLELDKIMESCSVTDDKMRLVSDCVWYWGNHMSNGEYDILDNEEEVEQLLKLKNIPLEWN
jgi:hypothetical protein